MIALFISFMICRYTPDRKLDIYCILMNHRCYLLQILLDHVRLFYGVFILVQVHSWSWTHHVDLVCTTSRRPIAISAKCIWQFAAPLFYDSWMMGKQWWWWIAWHHPSNIKIYWGRKFSSHAASEETACLQLHHYIFLTWKLFSHSTCMEN